MKYLLERGEMEQLMGDGFVLTLGSVTFTLIAEAAIRRQLRRGRPPRDDGVGVNVEPTGGAMELPADELICKVCQFPGPGRTTTKGGLAKHKTDMKHWEPELAAEAEAKARVGRGYYRVKNPHTKEAQQSKTSDIEKKDGWLIHTLCGFKTKKPQAIAGHAGPCRARHGQPYKGHRPDLTT